MVEAHPKVAVDRIERGLNACQIKKNVSVSLRRTVTGLGNVPYRLWMMGYARSATKRRGRQKQILWDARQHHIPVASVNNKRP
jgi:hypothetical protein